MKPNLQRDDGTLWESSFPKEGEGGHWSACLFDRDAECYFFREVERGPWYWPFYRRTGRIWRGTRNDPFPFTVIRQRS